MECPDSNTYRFILEEHVQFLDTPLDELNSLISDKCCSLDMDNGRNIPQLSKHVNGTSESAC